jgi:ABC-type multidrug transport system ATPase subunit
VGDAGRGVTCRHLAGNPRPVTVLPGSALSPIVDGLDPDPQPVISARGLSKSYGRARIQAVSNVSLSVARGEIVGLIGPDGAGKTSLLQMLAGVLRVDSGTATVAGVDVLRDPESVKAAIGYMPQGLGGNLYDALTVAENIEFFRDLRRVPRGSYQDNLERLLRVTRLAPFLNRAAGKLSGGMRQKLALICTLIHLPDVLLLDEPTTGVDPISRRDFWTIIHTLVVSRGVTVLLATSYMDEAERCHRVSLMHDGGVIAGGTPDQLTAALAGRLWAVRGVHVDDAVAALKESPAVQSTALAGGEVRVLVRDGAGDLAEQLQAAGLVGAALEPVAANLEDVFVHHLTRDRPLASAASLLAWRGVAPAPVEGARAVIQARQLTCRFGAFTAVDRVSLEVRAGEILGLLGPNGAGKTTLIKMLCGLERPTAGAATVGGYDVRRDRARLRGNIGYVSQRFSLYRDQTLRENLRLSAGLYGIPRAVRHRRIETVLSGLGLEAFADRLPLALPLGFRQRLALGCAILHEPRVLFLDEPTAGVDPLARRQFWDLVHLLAHQHGVTVLVSTHYMDEASHCDRLGFMHEGRLVGLGRPDDLTRQAVERGGPMVAVEAREFARAFVLLHEHFSGALLYGRRVRWQSPAPEPDVEEATRALAAAAITARVGIEALSMEDTFVSVIREAGLGDG